jgi:hypothetical protein
MQENKKLAVGVRAMIEPQHWLRGGEIGRLVRFDRRGQNHWLVRFEKQYPGSGIDGDKLWFDPSEFSEVIEDDSDMATIAFEREGNHTAIPA